MIVAAGSTDVTTYFVLRLAADGTELTGATITDIDLQYVRSGAEPSAKVDATALAATDSAHADNKAIEIDGTDQPGLYRVDWPDAAFAAGAREVILSVKYATAFTEHLRVELSPAVDAVALSGDTGAADNAESFFDGTGYAGTNNTIPTVTTLTNAPADMALNSTVAKEATLGVPANGTVSADLAAIKGDSAAILTDTGTDGVVVAAASKSGYALSAAGVQAVWEYGTRTLTSFGTLAADTASAVWAAGARTLTGFGSLVSDVATAVWGAVTRTLTAVTPPDDMAKESTLAAIKGVGWTDETLVTIQAAIEAIEAGSGASADEIWNELLAGHTTEGSTGAALTAIHDVITEVYGEGTVLKTFTSKDNATGLALPGVLVTCWRDATLVTQNGGTQVSDAEGKTRWLCVEGETYYFVQQLSGYTFEVEEEVA